MQVLNIASGVGLIVLYTYSVFDGMRGYEQWRVKEAAPARPQPMAVGSGATAIPCW